MQIHYRPAHPTDLDEIFALVRRAIAAMEANSIHQWDEVYPCREDLAEDISKGEMRVGVLSGRIAVIYVLNHETDEEYDSASWTHPERPWLALHRLCVHPDFQNHGVARMTLQHMEQECLSLGAEALRLDVFSENPYSQRLYDHAGFARTGVADWRMGRFYIMEKYLK